MLKIDNVSKDFGNFKLNNISFELEKGYIMGLIGPNGSGKTTLIKTIMGLLKQDSGDIYFLGENIKSNSKNTKENIGFVYDNLYFYESLKVKDFKNIVSSFYSNFEGKVFDDYINRFEISRNTTIKNLSKGQGIKLMLANALSHKAKLLILDEPTSGLDPIFRKDLMKILQECLQDEDKSIIFSTHITQDLEQIADYITFVNKGDMVFSESKEAINEKYKIIKGTKEELDSMNVDFIKRKDTKYFSEGLFIQNSYESNSNIKTASLEEIMYYYEKGDIHV